LYSQQGYEVKMVMWLSLKELDYINLPMMLKAYPSKTFFFWSWSANRFGNHR
jgi:hypothetical protein